MTPGYTSNARAASKPQVMVPSLNIFLGSTPTYSALEMMRQLQYLSPLDRRRVALVFIDIDSPPPEIRGFRIDHPGLFQEFDVKIEVLKGAVYADELDKKIRTHTYIPRKIPESFDSGAGGIRNNGHVAACTRHTKIANALDQAIVALGALGPERGAQPISEIQVNIVAFLGGGTGSGILCDIAVMARHRVLQSALSHRLNLFCLLPEKVGVVDEEDISWRKSNATAALLEVLALSMARNPDGGGPYVKYLLQTGYELRGEAIANEVYLFGRTGMPSITDAARIVGLELYTRVINASGIGFRERSQAIDRKQPGKRDKGLPTIFAATCPLEAVFPSHETALAFAKLTAARVLPLLVGRLSATGNALSQAEIQRVSDWEDALPIPDLLEFTEREFLHATRDRLNRLNARFDQQEEEGRQEVQKRAAALWTAEQRKLSGTALEPLEDRLQRVLSARRVYLTALNRLESANAPSRSKPDRQLQRSLLKAMNFNVFGRKSRLVNAVTDDFNSKQRRCLRATRYEELKQLLNRLVDLSNIELETLRKYIKTVDVERTVNELEREARASAAWRGKLEHAHIHRRHLFDLEDVAGMNARDGSSPPVERLYELLTGKKSLESYADEFNRWLADLHRNEAGLLAVKPGRLRERLIQYLQDEVYLPQLLELNIFDLLLLCCVLEGEYPADKVEAIIVDHLNHIGGLVREMVTFEEHLRLDGAGSINRSLFLSVHFGNNDQRTLMERASKGLQLISKVGVAPFLDEMIDPHRIQLVYGQHGISLGTIPEFYQASNSSMGEFLRHQRAWFGDGKVTYGTNNQPVFSSGEMERLVWNPNALNGGANGSSMRLPDRIIRGFQTGAGEGPEWHQAPTSGSPGSVAPEDDAGGDADASSPPEDLSQAFAPGDPGSAPPENDAEQDAQAFYQPEELC